VELQEEFMHVICSPVLYSQGESMPVRSLPSALVNEPSLERIGIVIDAQGPYVLAVSAVNGPAT